MRLRVGAAAPADLQAYVNADPDRARKTFVTGIEGLQRTIAKAQGIIATAPARNQAIMQRYLQGEHVMTMNFKPYITRDPTICGGDAVVTGTRVTVRTILASLAEGLSDEEILADFPTLNHDALRAVIAFAAASAEEDLPLPAMPAAA